MSYPSSRALASADPWVTISNNTAYEIKLSTGGFNIGYQETPKKFWRKSMTRSWGGLLVSQNLITRLTRRPSHLRVMDLDQTFSGDSGQLENMPCYVRDLGRVFTATRNTLWTRRGALRYTQMSHWQIRKSNHHCDDCLRSSCYV
ncbi:unnamed protein product [Trichogramma brassicae]|uniref:Uncharacterized protein n=1 Tax=Trichogramma brassicae TaxID=86971 RepID=A0A6H5IY76_9HYME|nr:unnamed protein product [Trichogramma brassicae]